MGTQIHRIKRLVAVLAFFLASVASAKSLASLPFDHRRLLLVQMEQTKVPNQAALSQILDEMRLKGRCQWVLASKPGEPIGPVLVPKDFSWDSPPSVRKMAEKYEVDGLVWIQQRGQEILLKWYDAKDGMPLVFESIFVAADEPELPRIKSWIGSIWSKFPGVGYVAKRDSKFVYFEGAAENALEIGTEIKILRVESASRHQLFKTFVDFKATPVGRAKIVSIDKTLARAELLEESNLDPVKMGDRYDVLETKTQISAVQEVISSDTDALNNSQQAQDSDVSEPLPASHHGTLAVVLGYGRTSHSEVTEDGVDPELKRNAPALELHASGFITSKWMGWADYRYRFSSFKNPGSNFNNESFLNARLTSLGFLFGYRFSLGDSLQSVEESLTGSRSFLGGDDRLWIAPFVGYRKYSFVAVDQTLNYGPTSKSWSALAIGVNLRFPLSDAWHVRVAASKSIFMSFTEGDEKRGGNPAPTAAEVTSSLHVKTSKSDNIGLGFRYQSLGATYDGAATQGVTATRVSVKVSELMLSYETLF